jgi:hypothetical protein
MSKKATIEQRATDQFVTQLKEVDIGVPKMLITSEDRVKSCLESYLSDVEKRRDWLAFFGVFLTLLATLLTTSFNDFFINNSLVISKYTFQAVFMVGTALSFIWSIKLFIQRPKLKTAEEIIVEIKGNEGHPEPSHPNYVARLFRRINAKQP